MRRILLNAGLVTIFAGMAIVAMNSIMPAGYYVLLFCASVSAQIAAKKWLP